MERVFFKINIVSGKEKRDKDQEKNLFMVEVFP